MGEIARRRHDYFVYEENGKYFIFGDKRYITEQLKEFKEISIDNSIGIRFNIVNNLYNLSNYKNANEYVFKKECQLLARCIKFLDFFPMYKDVKLIDFNQLRVKLEEQLTPRIDQIKFYILLETDYLAEDENVTVYNIMEKLGFNIDLTEFSDGIKKSSFYLARQGLKLPIDFDKIEKLIENYETQKREQSFRMSESTKELFKHLSDAYDGFGMQEYEDLVKAVYFKSGHSKASEYLNILKDKYK